MTNRRGLLQTFCAAGTVGIAGCGGPVRGVLGGDPPVVEPCKDGTWTWPTAGGDPGRTGWTDTAPPAADAAVVDLLGSVRENGRQRLASSAPVVADGKAYVSSGSEVVVLDIETPADGAIWVHDLDDDVAAVPAISCGVVLGSGLNHLVALDPESGERYWQADVGGHGETALAATDGTVYVAGIGSVAVDIHTGDVQWHADGGDTLAVGGNRVYSTRNVDGDGGIFAHDLQGEQRWHLSLGKIVGSASVLDGTVWVADNEGKVYAIDGETGETYWSKSPDGVGKIHSGLAVKGEDLVVPAGGGETSVVLDPATGETRWSVDTGMVTGRPVVGEGWVALGRTNSGVSVYDRTTGEMRNGWSREDYDLGTVDAVVPVDEGFVIREGTTSGLSLIR